MATSEDRYPNGLPPLPDDADAEEVVAFLAHVACCYALATDALFAAETDEEQAAAITRLARAYLTSRDSLTYAINMGPPSNRKEGSDEH